jgi:hypothetical protein
MAIPTVREYGELLDFTVQPDASVIISVGTVDGYGHDVLIPHASLIGMAEAAKAQREFAERAEAAKLRTVDYFYAQPKL